MFCVSCAQYKCDEPCMRMSACMCGVPLNCVLTVLRVFVWVYGYRARSSQFSALRRGQRCVGCGGCVTELSSLLGGGLDLAGLVATSLQGHTA